MTTYRFQRDLPAESGYDLIVAGGGPAGTAAAISAARLGARVLLAEATGCLGGMGTSGMVAAFDPMANGERNLVGGIMLEILETLYERKELPPQVTPDYWHRYFQTWTPFNPESLKRRLDEFALDAGVEVRFFTRVVEADIEDKLVKGVVLSQVDGRCASSDLKVHGSIRVMPAAGLMGQAAGTAAVQSIRSGQTACDLDTEQLVLSLRQQDAVLEQPGLSKTMTRST